MFKLLMVDFVLFSNHFEFIFQTFKICLQSTTKLFSKSIIENTNWSYICNFIENYTDVIQFKCTMQNKSIDLMLSCNWSVVQMFPISNQ